MGGGGELALFAYLLVCLSCLICLFGWSLFDVFCVRVRVFVCVCVFRAYVGCFLVFVWGETMVFCHVVLRGSKDLLAYPK